jgi:flagellar biosynthesis protein FlhB
MSGDRTERASPRKRQKAAEKGDRVHSRELVSAAAMLCGALALGAMVARWAGQSIRTFSPWENRAVGRPRERLSRFWPSAEHP